MRHRHIKIVAAALCAATLAACGGSAASPTPSPASGAAGGGVSATPSAQPPTGPQTGPTGPSPVPTESPIPPENNPPGDIPDNTAFVPYRSTDGGFTISVPEGWARTTAKGAVTFTDKLNTVEVTWKPASSAPTVASAKSTEVPDLERTTRAFVLKRISTATLPAGQTVLIEYQANSDPNPVTGKQYRLDVLRYELFRGGTELVLTLLSPVGADNVDPWRVVTQSLTWR